MIDLKSFIVIIFILCSVFSLAQQPKLISPIGHSSKGLSVSFSPNGKMVLTIFSGESTVIIWDVSSTRILQRLKGHTSLLRSAFFSSDGKSVITSSEDGTAIIWDIESGKIIHKFEEQGFMIKSASFSPDSQMALTYSDFGINIWNIKKSEKLLNYYSSSPLVTTAIFSPDSKKVLITSDDHTIKVLDVINNKFLSPPLQTEWINVVNFSPDSRKIITGSLNEDGTAPVWDLASGKIIFPLAGHLPGSIIKAACFSPDSSKMLTASTDGNAIIWDANNGKLLHTLEAHKDRIDFASFSPDSKMIVTCSADETAKVWDVASGKILYNFKNTAWDIPESFSPAISACFSPDSKKLITLSEIGISNVYDMTKGSLLSTLKGHSYAIYFSGFSPDGKKIITLLNNGTAKIWDATNGRLIQSFGMAPWRKFNCTFSPDSKKVLTVSADHIATIWDISKGDALLTFNDNKAGVQAAIFSPDNSKVFTILGDGKCKVWGINGNSKKLLYTLGEKKMPFHFICFSPDGQKFIAQSQNNSLTICDVKTGKSLHPIGKIIPLIKENDPLIIPVSFSDGGKRIVTISDKHTAKIWDVQSGRLLKSISYPLGEFTNASLSPNGDEVIIVFNSGAASIYNVSSGKPINYIEDNDSTKIISAVFSPDGNNLITITNTNNAIIFERGKDKRNVQFGENSDVTIPEIRRYIDKFYDINFSSKKLVANNISDFSLYDYETGKKLYTVEAFDSADYFVRIPSGYYQSTPNAAKLLHYVTKDLKVISFEQLDVKYNRPDLVLEAIDNPDTTLINAYRNAYYKRIKKLGIDTTSFRDGYSVPEADFVDRDNIPPEQSTENITIHLKGADSTYSLDRYNVWVNEVPIYGQRGINIRTANSKSFDKTVCIPLSAGENRIETSITNVNGTESYRMPLTVTYTPAVKPKETIYFIGIGIDHFADASNNLKYCSKDIRDLSASLKKKFGDNIIIDTLFNEKVSVSNILALKKKLLQSTVNDKVIISYSGHGLLSKDKDYFLSTYNINFSNPDENGLPYSDLESLLDSIPARKKLLLIDACHSGEVDKEEIQSVTTNKAALDSNHVVTGKKAFGNIVTNTEGAKKLGSKSSIELVQSLFVNVGKNTGATIIAAAAGTEFALENGDLKNGVFTYSIMEAMNKYPTMKITELKKRVGARVEELTKGMQKPTSRNEAIAVDWEVW